MNYLLAGIRIEGFRGINNQGDPLDLSFDPDKVNSIFAQNAQGKSSIYEALCYAIKGDIPKLRACPSSDRPGDYYTNRFHTPQASEILLRLQRVSDGGAVEIKIERDQAGTRSVTSPSGEQNPEGILAGLNNAFCLLDASEFNRFVADSPLERGRTFSGLLGLSALSETRQVLGVLANRGTRERDLEITSLDQTNRQYQGRIDSATARLTDSFKSLTGESLSVPHDPKHIGERVIEVLKGIALLQKFVDGKELNEIDFDALRGIIRQAEKGEDQDRLRTLLDSMRSLESIGPAVLLDDDRKRLDHLIEERLHALEKTRGPLIKDVYDAVTKVLSSGDWADLKLCPACESKLEENLDQQIKIRLEQYEAVERLSAEIVTTWAGSGLRRRIRSLLSVPELARESKYNDLFVVRDRELSEGRSSSASLNEVHELLGALEAALGGTQTALQAEIDRLRTSLPPSLVTLVEQLGHAEEIKKSLEEVVSVTEKMGPIVGKLAQRKRWTSFVDLALATFSDAEVRFSTAKTLALQADFQAAYKEITKNPEVVPVLEKSTVGEELNLRLERFYGLEGLAASTLLSESYRNALAIAIFLSAAKREVRSGFMVLDDVTSSFDAGHQFAVMEFIRNSIARPGNPIGPQMLILSHDTLLEKYFDRLSGETAWKHQRIQGSPPRGAVVVHGQGQRRLRDSAELFLNAGQVEQAEPFVRQYLEFTLLEIIRRVGIPVPIDFAIRDDRKMVQNSIECIKESVDLHQRAGDLILDQAQVNALKNAHVTSIMTNWVSHYSTGSSPTFTAYTLLAVLDSIDKLADCFRYDCLCGGGSVQRKYFKNLTQKACGC